MKLMRSEAESDALRHALTSEPRWTSSALLGVESRRAAARGGSAARERAETIIGSVVLLAIDEPILRAAADLSPPSLRSLDALHLATALSLGEDLSRMYCYDARLTEAATARGIEVVAPR